ncbi:excisionase [bacterium (Candidatus Howlettbacteria) CG_4_10_14_0_8_um_filter_40_9]|nr:MAG: excisionase [bacterium (Candidatus Howlettbacteria) CG_4_10_14_0_8_um_filter_40_9]
MEKFLTVKEVAQKMSVCQRTIIRHIKQKKLRASKMGHWRIKESDLEIFFNANANTKHEK